MNPCRLKFRPGLPWTLELPVVQKNFCHWSLVNNSGRRLRLWRRRTFGYVAKLVKSMCEVDVLSPLLSQTPRKTSTCAHLFFLGIHLAEADRTVLPRESMACGAFSAFVIMTCSPREVRATHFCLSSPSIRMKHDPR